MKQQESKNRVIGLLTSLGFHGALLLLFLLTISWKAPGPPAAEFGVVVNMGFDDVGSGDVQTDKPVATEDDPKEEIPKKEEPQPEPVVTRPAKVEKEEVLAAEEESPVVVKKEEPKKIEPKKEEPKKEKEQPKKEPEKLLTEYKPSSSTTPTSTKGGGSEGDDVNKTGNKGQPDGNLDPNGQYTGKPGGGGGGDGGIGLSMNGWKWSERPSTAGISNNESGRIVFEIECDDSGEIIGIKTLERGVSAAAEQALKKELMRVSLESTVKGGVIPDRSKGTVTFVIKSR
jgi:protein TonB